MEGKERKKKENKEKKKKKRRGGKERNFQLLLTMKLLQIQPVIYTILV